MCVCIVMNRPTHTSSDINSQNCLTNITFYITTILITLVARMSIPSEVPLSSMSVDMPIELTKPGSCPGTIPRKKRVSPCDGVDSAHLRNLSEEPYIEETQTVFVPSYVKGPIPIRVLRIATPDKPPFHRSFPCPRSVYHPRFSIKDPVLIYDDEIIVSDDPSRNAEIIRRPTSIQALTSHVISGLF